MILLAFSSKCVAPSPWNCPVFLDQHGHDYSILMERWKESESGHTAVSGCKLSKRAAPVSNSLTMTSVVASLRVLRYYCRGVVMAVAGWSMYRYVRRAARNEFLLYVRVRACARRCGC